MSGLSGAVYLVRIYLLHQHQHFLFAASEVSELLRTILVIFLSFCERNILRILHFLRYKLRGDPKMTVPGDPEGS